ncbi:orotidine 5'-phosphate decarboxylase [Propionibacterium sp. oral taxon 192 str. F0372]|uniref:orotidine-5'-phosphate decarboxylase n=1 Tax=Propionibacterium sp. oral taxon 192 TaxID=671222 RepID=UPI000353F4BE|nr:orotidine-5'-phosphate decarboxylase [Propionibacterium sp. oral taxon 192]EPH02771.1 orotidine 5'-phosphate decarboxylase [Propionibacterium sp. oral taxon 192 str. F0372]
MSTFCERLDAVTAVRGRLCVGIDPHEKLIRGWGYDYDLNGLERLSRTMVEALGDIVPVFKPQSAFFEAFGAPGMRVLAQVLADIADVGALSILDVKRGDIGSTMAAYAHAYLSGRTDLSADAITVSPFLGFDSLAPALELAVANDRGLYVLARTSNPEGFAVQTALRDGVSVAQEIVNRAMQANSEAGTDFVGLVIGATHQHLDVDLTGFGGSILAPGIGVQGGTVDTLRKLFGEVAGNTLPSVSRQVISAGPLGESLRNAVAALMV